MIENIDNTQIEQVSNSLADGIEQNFANVVKRLSEWARKMKKTYDEHKDEIDAEVEKYSLERERLQESMPEILVGDIIREKSIHCSELYCYQVDSIERGCYVSHTAHFSHDRNDIVAVYRFDGMDFKCIWERGDYKEYKMQ